MDQHGSVPVVSIIIVNYNTRERTLECLRSITASPSLDLEVIVVDNGSHDGSAEAFLGADLAHRTAVIAAGDNLGFARGVNLGVSHAHGDFILLLNPDTTVRPGTIEHLVSFASAHPHHGVYGGRTLRPDGTLDPSSCWGEMTLWSLICFATLASTTFKGSFLDPESLGRWERDTVREVPIITGCLLLTARDVWDHLGGMDERYFLYGEDAAFSSEARRLGYRPVVVPEAVIVHDVGASTGSTGRKRGMVMAGRTTLIRHTWRRPRRDIGIALLILGTWVRATLERALRRSPDWILTWEMRDAWLPGYPRSEELIFQHRPGRAD